MILASNLPDIDAVLQILPHGFNLRRTATHSLLGMPLLALAAAWLARWLTPQFCFSHRFTLILGASVLHTLMDLPNSFGVALLWPFTSRRFELASVFVVDLVFWILPVTALILPWVWKRYRGRERALAGRVIVLLAIYTFGCTGARWLVHARVSRELAAGEELTVYHEPFGPGLWRAVVRNTAAQYRVYGVQLGPLLLGTEDGIKQAYVRRNDEATSTVQAILRANPHAARMHAFFRTPVWEVTSGTVRAVLRDLRFSSLRLSGRQPFVFEFGPDRLPGREIQP
jgi:membrane-bound metal-dependent hydrolase YbcI (DUF457 family)